MPSFRASAVTMSITALVTASPILLSGCASSRLAAEPPAGVRLAGDWKLDPARSDDLGKAIEQLRAQSAKARHGMSGGQQQGFGGYAGRRHMGGGGPGGQQAGQSGQGENASESEGGGQEVGAGPAPRASAVDELMSNVPRGDYLRITVTSDAFTITSGDSSNQFTPGVESDISAEQGDAQQTSGWKGPAYVIDTKPELGPEIIQTYALAEDGRLTMTLRLTGGGTNFTFTRVYDRTTRVAPLAPPTTN